MESFPCRGYVVGTEQSVTVLGLGGCHPESTGSGGRYRVVPQFVCVFPTGRVSCVDCRSIRFPLGGSAPECPAFACDSSCSGGCGGCKTTESGDTVCDPAENARALNREELLLLKKALVEEIDRWLGPFAP